MSCYDIDTGPIEHLNQLLRNLSRDNPVDWTDEDNPPFHRVRPEQSIAIVSAYLNAFSCFLLVLRAVMIRRIALLGLESRRFAYLQPFLVLYTEALQRLDNMLRSLFQDIFSNNADLAANFVAQIVASGTPTELEGYVMTVPIATSAEEAKEHGEAGKQVTDSMKRLLRILLLKVPMLKTKKNREEWVDHTLHLINEVLGVVFRTVA